MLLIIRLLKHYPKFARAFRDFAIGFAVLVDIDPKDIDKWFSSTPQEQQQMLHQPLLDGKLETLFASYQKHVDTQHEIIALKREIGTLPALPDEGY